MWRFGFSEEQALCALGAARAVATADGAFEAHERRLLEAAARALGVDAAGELPPVASPARVREVLDDDEPARTRLVQALLVVAMMDGEVVAAELEAIRAYAEALGVDEPRLRNLAQLMRGQARLVKFDLWRRSEMLRGALRKAWEAKGLRGLWQFVGGNDLAHVLGGYDTDPVGECEVVAFIAGFMRSDPFSYLFQLFVHMQLGVEIFDGSPVERLAVPPERVLAALERGAQVRADLYDPGWDFWADFELPLDVVRARYNVLPKG